MELALSENIRRFRKERKLTQEQLAEVLGVTAGAVYKWESGLSVPELGLIMDLADFFDTSVDALLGYRVKDNRPESTIRRLMEYCRTMDREALAEAEKALKKYPNSFQIVLHCAYVYNVFGVGGGGRAELKRALELYEQARLLLSQNTDPEISEFTVYGAMAGVHLLLGEHETGLELLKKHNVGGLFSDSIAVCLAVQLGRPEEAEPWLTETLLNSALSLLDAVAGYVFLFCSRRDYASARRILDLGMGFLHGLRQEQAPDFLVKMDGVLYLLLAHIQLSMGEKAEARISAETAAGLVKRFDAAPNYTVSTTPFTGELHDTYIHDGLGATAAESVETVLGLLKNEELTVLWKEVGEHE